MLSSVDSVPRPLSVVDESVSPSRWELAGEQVPPDLRKALSALRQRTNTTNFVYLCEDWFVIVGSVSLAAAMTGWGHWAAYLVAVVLIGSRQRALANLTHEASHRKLFASRHLNDTAARLACAWPLFADVPNGRVYSECLYRAAATLSSQVQNQADEQAVPIVSKSRFAEFETPLPALAEQRKIATALRDADDLVVSLECLITKKQAIKQGMIQELLTGRTRFPGFLQPWSRSPFAVAPTRLNVKKYQVPASSYGAVGSVPFLDQGQQAIVGYTDTLAATFRPGRGGVIVFGDHTCITKFVDFAFAVGADGTQVVKAMVWNVTQFFAYVLEHDPIASTGYNRYVGFLSERTFVIPPRDEQLAIVAVLADVDAEIKALITRLAKARDIKQGMM